MKNTLVPILICLTPIGVACQQSTTTRPRITTSAEPIAILNAQTGQALLRDKPGEKVVRVKKEKDLGKELYAPAEIRCEKKCTIELLLCTGDRVLLKEEDGWYRIPVLSCEREKFIPGFKNYFLPGGRKAQLRRSFVLGDILGAIIGSPGGASIGASIGAASSGSVGPKCSREYGEGWTFEYPEANADVIPDLFEIDLANYHFSKTTTNENARLIVTLMAFDKTDLVTPTRQITENLDFQFGPELDIGLTTQKIKAFLREAKKDSRRIFCTITIAPAANPKQATRSPFDPHTFGIEFHLADDALGKAVLENLAISDTDRGLARFIGRANIFEELGLWRLARAEYKKALELAPENDALQSKLSRLSNPCDW